MRHVGTWSHYLHLVRKLRCDVCIIHKCVSFLNLLFATLLFCDVAQGLPVSLRNDYVVYKKKL